MDNTVFVNKRFCGPPDSGNGGYVCGRLARFIDGTAEVRLFRPPPLEKAMAVVMSETGTVQLRDGDSVVAEGRSSALHLEVPCPLSFDEAHAASMNYVSVENHFFPTCFVCGPARRKGDGLCIFPGTVAGRDMVASAWTPDETLVDEMGQVRREFIWASLDCPGAFAVLGASIRPVVLGSLTAEILKAPGVNHPCIAMGWKIGSEGRKHLAGTALLTREGELLAKARAVWIEPR